MAIAEGPGQSRAIGPSRNIGVEQKEIVSEGVGLDDFQGGATGS